MTVAETSFDDLTSFEALLRAHKRALRRKRANRVATAFDSRVAAELVSLQDELRSGRYRPAPYRRKTITEPKVRQIEAPAYRDRIVQHALHAELSPLFERFFIRDSFACRVGRGVHAAADRVQHFLRRPGPELYVCQLDISKYYASINHARLMQILRRRVTDPRILDLLETIIASTDSGDEHNDLFPPDSPFHTNGRRGIPIGNLTSQLFANIYLHEADAYAKQTLKIRSYVRYMDDILFFHPDKRQLHEWRNAMTRFLETELHLTVNPRKVRVYPARAGVSFVGYTIFATHRRLRGSSVRRFTRRFRAQLRAMARGRTSPEAVRASLRSWEAHAAHASSGPLIEHLRGKFDGYLFVLAVYRALARQRRAQRKPVQLPLLDEGK